MFENIINFFKKTGKKEENTKKQSDSSKDAAKERLHLVLMQDRANVSADFLELMKQEIIEVIKKYIDVDEKEIDVRLTNRENEDGTNGAPALYANIPILNIKNEARKFDKKDLEIKQQNDEEEREEPIEQELSEEIEERPKEEIIEIEENEEDEYKDKIETSEEELTPQEIIEEVIATQKKNEKQNSGKNS